MQELEKILKEINETIERYGENPYIDEKVTDLCYGMNITKGIIRKYISGKDADVPVKDGWIPMEERLPEDKRTVWISMKSGNVKNGTLVKEYSFKDNEAFICDDGFVYKNMIYAWKPIDIPEPYRPEKEEQ